MYSNCSINVCLIKWHINDDIYVIYNDIKPEDITDTLSVFYLFWLFYILHFASP